MKKRNIIIISILAILLLIIIVVISFIFIKKGAENQMAVTEFLEDMKDTERISEEYLMDSEAKESYEDIYRKDAIHVRVNDVEIITPYEFPEKDYSIDSYGEFLTEAVRHDDPNITTLTEISEEDTSITYKSNNDIEYTFEYGGEAPYVQTGNKKYTWEK